MAKSEAVMVKPAHWWSLALIGVFQIITGVLALVYTNVTLLALGIIFGVNLLLAGTMLVVLGAGDENAGGGVKTVRIVVGFLTTLAGLIAIVRPGASVLVLLLCLSFWFILTGVAWLTEAFTSPNHRALNGVLGLAGIAAGIILVGDPDIGLNTLANLAGILLIARGAIELAAGLYIKTQS
jgi:uncharacterized membrane protein HdeD (DUF308 family)